MSRQAYLDAVKAAIEAHNHILGESHDDDEIWHLVFSLVVHCDAQEPRLDLDQILEDVRRHIRSAHDIDLLLAARMQSPRKKSGT